MSIMITNERYTIYDNANPPTPGTWLVTVLNAKFRENGSGEVVPVVAAVEDTETGQAWAMVASDHERYIQMIAAGASMANALAACAMTIEPELRPASPPPWQA